MIQVLEGTRGNVLGVEITGGYTKDDVKEFIKAFEARIEEGRGRVNVLVKIDGMELKESHLNALIEDSVYAWKHRDRLRHVAVVGHSKLEKFLIVMDNWMFGKEEDEVVEKYLDVEGLDKVWEFARS